MRLFFLVFILVQNLHAQESFPDISVYKVAYSAVSYQKQNWIGLRQFLSGKKNYVLLVNPATLDTRIANAKACIIRQSDLSTLRKTFSTTPYFKGIKKAEAQSVNIQDAGIAQAALKETGINLTIDLCPSHKPLDRNIFTSIFKEFQKIEKPAPVAISVSGLWMLKHTGDLNWLKQMERKGEIDISWINHSYHHRVSKTLPLKENFLLEPGTNIADEILLNEQLMLKNGLVPSVFFRFPGLVSDQSLITKITGFGLIPIGSDAWLAKGQKPNQGSIVLIHGNGNEPLGVQDFLSLIRSEQGSISKRQWLLYDLRETVTEDVQ